MPVVIGVDEAGYGPNYGPLCVATTAWRVPEEAVLSATAKKIRRPAAVTSPASPRAVASSPTASTFPDLYKLLRKAVGRLPDKAGKRIAIADSKELYKSGFGVRQLERGVLAALASIESDDGSATPCIERVSQLLAAAAPDSRRCTLPCHAGDDQPLPVEELAEEICRLAALFRRICRDSGVALLAMRVHMVYPAEFNELVDYFGSKGAALTDVTLALVRRTIDSLPIAHCPQPTQICLDKHGGRSRYAAMLQHHFPDSWIERISENRNRSSYRWRHGESDVEAVFRVGCEELLPTALASMAAKYHRELAMQAFNNFWTERLPGLRPTCGYPGDSRRFKADIAPLQAELGIDDRLLWRCR